MNDENEKTVRARPSPRDKVEQTPANDADSPNPQDRIIIPSPDARPSGVTEVGGPSGPEPTRYGDWERKGRCIDF